MTQDLDDTFAFIIHPIDPRRDVTRKYPALRHLPVWLIEFLSLFYPPVYISEIQGVTSAYSGRELHGWFLACPLTPRMMMRLPPAVVYRKIIQAGRLAERLGARILGLGAFTSVVGDGGRTIAHQLDIPVTTGNSYTVAVAVQALREAAATMGRPLSESTVAVVGANGTIGAVCAELLAPECDAMLLLGRDEQALAVVAEKARAVKRRADAKRVPDQGRAPAAVTTSTDLGRLAEAGLVVTVTSAVEQIVEPHHLQAGAIVCDVARPRDVSEQVARVRPDVLVIEGGMVRVPGPVDFGFDFGFPSGMAYACMAETMALALEGQYMPFSLGKRVTLPQVLAIDKMATRHGFRLGGFRSFERAVTAAEIASVRSYATALPRGEGL